MYRYIFVLLIISSCTQDNIEDYFPNIDCDSENVFYQAQDPLQSIARIIETKCLDCHQKGNVINELSLESYDDVSSYVTIDVINNMANPMPPDDRVQLTDCEKLKIENWINNGYEAAQ
jgi:uncharacterized membrane protein